MILGEDPEKLLEKLSSIAKRVAKELQGDMKKEAEVRAKVCIWRSSKLPAF